MTAKLMFKGLSLYAVWSTFVSGMESLFLVASDRGETMLFTSPEWIQYLGLAIGIIFMIIVAYFFKYQAYMKSHPDKMVKFEVKYVIAAVCTMLTAAIVAYVIQFFGLGYIAPETQIAQGSLAFIIALFVGGAVTFVIDACLFHPIVDCSAAMIFNQTQQKIREAAASEEAKKKIMAAVTEKAKALGLIDEAKVAALAKMVDGPEDPSFALYVQLLLK